MEEMEENELYEIGKRLAEARKRRGIKQIDAAGEFGIKQSNLSAIEAGKVKLSTDVLVKACKKYGVTADYLLYGKELKEITKYEEKLLEDAIAFDDIIRDLHYLSDEDIEELRMWIQSKFT